MAERQGGDAPPSSAPNALRGGDLLLAERACVMRTRLRPRGRSSLSLRRRAPFQIGQGYSHRPLDHDPGEDPGHRRLRQGRYGHRCIDDRPALVAPEVLTLCLSLREKPGNGGGRMEICPPRPPRDGRPAVGIRDLCEIMQGPDTAAAGPRCRAAGRRSAGAAQRRPDPPAVGGGAGARRPPARCAPAGAP